MTLKIPGFKYLEDIDSTIPHRILYAGNDNIIGRPIAGYLAPRCIVSEVLGKNLSAVQKDAQSLGLSLLVYDAYRPFRAVEDFVFWSQDTHDQIKKDFFYPRVNKADFFALGYVGMRSYHCRGAAVDVTLVPLSPYNEPLIDQPLDMGTVFDYMDELSHTENTSIGSGAQENRQRLCRLMEKHGFENYPHEWWHFNLKEEPFPHTYFDFPVG